jgi:hypothetical protein
VTVSVMVRVHNVYQMRTCGGNIIIILIVGAKRVLSPPTFILVATY